VRFWEPSDFALGVGLLIKLGKAVGVPLASLAIIDQLCPKFQLITKFICACLTCVSGKPPCSALHLFPNVQFLFVQILYLSNTPSP